MSKCWDKFTLKCATVALLLFIESIIARRAGAVWVFSCVCVCVCVLLRLYFDKPRRGTCERRLLNLPQWQKKKNIYQKANVFMWSFSAECLCAAGHECIYFILSTWKIDLAWKMQHFIKLHLQKFHFVFTIGTIESVHKICNVCMCIRGR